MKKVYVILDDCVWNYESLTNVVAVADNLYMAKKILKNYIERVKFEVNFDGLEKQEDRGEYELNSSIQWIYEESENHFLLYENGDYTKNHININIATRNIKKDYTNSKFTVIENGSKIIYEDKDLALRCYLDLCEIADEKSRNEYFDTYLKIKKCGENIITDNSKIIECSEYTYMDYVKEHNFESKYNDELDLQTL